MKKILHFITLVLAVTVLNACSVDLNEGNIPKTNIVLLHGWGTMSKEDVLMREIYADFNKENPDIELTLVSMPSFDSLETKAKNMLAIGKMPNIIYTGAGSLETLYTFMVEKNNAVDLLPYMMEDEDFRNSVSPEILKRWQTAEGRLYTVTDVMDTRGYWYNKKIFTHAGIEKLPTTWKEFMEAGQKIKAWSEREGWETVVLDLDSKKSATLLQAMIEEADIRPYLEGEKKLELIYHLKFLKGLVEENMIKKVDNIFKDPLFNFKVGHSAIYVGEVWEEKEFSPNMEVGYALFPSWNEKPIAEVSVSPGYIISNQGTKEQLEAGIKFLKFMLSEETQTRILKEVGRIPTNPQVKIDGLKQARRRLYDNFALISEAKHKKETPENSWNSYTYRKFAENISFYLKGEINEVDLMKEMAGGKHLQGKSGLQRTETEGDETVIKKETK